MDVKEIAAEISGMNFIGVGRMSKKRLNQLALSRWQIEKGEFLTPEQEKAVLKEMR